MPDLKEAQGYQQGQGLRADSPCKVPEARRNTSLLSLLLALPGPSFPFTSPPRSPLPDSPAHAHPLLVAPPKTGRLGGNPTPQLSDEEKLLQRKKNPQQPSHALIPLFPLPDPA